jgi:hypothetical protein
MIQSNVPLTNSLYAYSTNSLLYNSHINRKFLLIYIRNKVYTYI